MKLRGCGLNEKAANTTLDASNYIRVSQGDSDGIGLEVFLKSILLLARNKVSNFILYCNSDDLKKTLDSMQIPYILIGELLHLSKAQVRLSFCLSAFDCFNKALSDIKHGDVLFTLPASKKTFPKDSPGHTAYLRNVFKKDLAMCFTSPKHNIVLLSDHISLANVESFLTVERIVDTATFALKGFAHFFNKNFRAVYFSGINPHAGENGILGNDHSTFENALKKLGVEFSSLSLFGPQSGDTIFQHSNSSNLIVYAHHDQGLSPFKSHNKYLGANLTFGLDFLRLSVDHGTAPDNYGKNISNPMGCYYCAQLALDALGR